MDLFGIDVIIDCDNGRHAVIDINAFPGESTIINFTFCSSLVIVGSFT